MKILVTGGAGFIASHVVDAYIAQGHEVVVADNLSTGTLENLNPQAKFVKVDITSRDEITALITQERPEVLNLHAAHIQVGNSVKDPQFDAENNIMGLIHIMQAAKDAGVTKVIMASTGGAMYGNKQTPFTEEMKEEPVSPYGVSKRSGELYLNYYKEQYGIPYVVLRYSNVYGPRQNPHGESGVIAIFSELIAQGKTAVINGDGSHTRDYVFVSDVVQANLTALSTTFVGALNIGTGRQISTLDVYTAVAQEFGLTTPPQFGAERPGEQVHSSLSATKAQEVLGWQPQVSFEDGVKQVVAWYKSRSV